MRIPRYFIDELMAKVDIVDLINSYVPLRKTGQNYTACCPFHTEKTPSFTVSHDKQFYYCFGCGASGSAISFMLNYARLEFVEAVQELASRAGMEVVYEQNDFPSVDSSIHDLYKIMEQVAKYYRDQLRKSQTAINYLKKRGLTGEIARDFGLGYAPAGWDNLLKTFGDNAETRNNLLKTGLTTQNESGKRYDRFRDRIMFPIQDRRGRIIAFGGRILDQSKPKYLNSPETSLFQKGSELYGWYLARKKGVLKTVIVVEGYMDVVALAQHGIYYAIATLGTATTVKHLTFLFRNVSEIIFCFDGDEAGQKAAWRALETALPLLQGGRQIRFIFLPQNNDPDDLIRSEGLQAFNEHITQATSLSEFLFNTLQQQVDMNSIDGRAKLVELAKPLLNQLPAGTYQELMSQELSRLTGINNLAVPKLPLKKYVKNSFRELSLVHQTIVYLLHQPELVKLIKYPEKLSFLEQQDIKLLLTLIEFIQIHPQLKLGVICEHWRGMEHESTINLLATQKVLITDQITDEFVATIDNLYKSYQEQRIKFLTQKVTQLTSEEKQELRTFYQLPPSR
ncbi:DNA primase [Candidatus Halobeggiatoa sp. HSG11]|nr:DNA primase [Candidatus Halobeggiatoa sp. HSG11]